MCYCFGSGAAKEAEEQKDYDVSFNNKLTVGCCGCLAWGISIPICYYYKLFWDESVTN